LDETSEKYRELAPGLTICKILNGMWQVAGGHGYIDQELAIADMMRYHDADLRTWDLADIYGPAEDFVGQFGRRLSALRGIEELDRIQALTKLVPQPMQITRSIVKENVQRSLCRMGVSSLALLQFHWWDYNNPYYMDALRYLPTLETKELSSILVLQILTQRGYKS
jgi:aryl-alcohol dehydrogenase-like predicted oxidoreductase